ncbi:MAG: hypothetical protein K2Q10_02575, partial [Rhodospirillales bacterium]|nr:hypothetical protein [Rhodospirillales bacterium]
MDHPVLTLAQALQLTAIGQCALAMLYLGVSGGRGLRGAVGIGFFLCLSASYAAPLLDGMMPVPPQALLLTLQAAMPAASLLLVYQVLSGRPPDARLWLCLALPLAAGPPAWTDASGAELCLGPCLDGAQAFKLFRVLGGAVTLLATVMVAHHRRQAALIQPHGRERIGLGLALIGVNVATLAASLAALTGHLEVAEGQFTEAALGLAFVYLATTMLFRIYPEASRGNLPLPPQGEEGREANSVEQAKAWNDELSEEEIGPLPQ